ncbi:MULTISPECIES: SmdB family multidrug efflux ABC transporter permease/ATP-binding protein [Providencia]|uniref:SmdB family multidrug efflux ABC transporter permease/ATP-binding protein n=1 Tax=Providencia huaxiensis TaxID=2027290 RepID=A0ABU2ITV3_9GAMM|nr:MULTISPECIES: SmdB family multidrug efflux ABC transporter permease/ATP-binding protein [Providencia]MBZ3682925.1 SmdB family multidrug efflux ABC transporter permease/ATP-binding protein [Providencia rettgeri]AXH62645.1 SmdB family multidrug efflux ABC transporter permease/ATP-binding protein [Providencia huaxiensis]MDT0132501.1 SmdB family multidrug efflux ABC transporter permease/ATP-binding protein [Providencia huaxiensis]MDT1978907.1 SmdB family multidrug efflux ABC transporter permease
MSQKKPLWPALKRLLSYGKAHRGTMGIAIAMLWLAAIAEVSGPLLISYFIDNMIAKKQIIMPLALYMAVGFILLQVIAALLHYYQIILFNKASVGVVQTLRTDVMNAALRQPLSAFDKQPVGQLISRVTNDTEVIKDLFVMVVPTVFRSLALICAMLVAMFSLEWRMASIAVMIFPAVFVVMLVYQRLSTPIVRRVRSYLADINNGFNEVISGMTVIQQFIQQARFGEKMQSISQDHYFARMKALKLDGLLLRPLLSLLSASVLCGLLLLFGFEGTTTIGVGVLYAFINYLGRLNEPLIELTSQQSMLQQAVVSGERVFELMDSPQQDYGESIEPLQGGSISINHLSFAYRDNKMVLKDINLHVPDNNFVALVGHTGSGKSTIANLIMGYYPWQEGDILLDGRDLSSLSHQVLRHGIAMVQQDPVVLAASFFDNVALGREISQDKVWEVIETVQLAELVRGLPDGLDTVLGEQGNTLSVGQRQLLAMARVLVVTPKILILDEATANIDSGTEQAIQKALRMIRQHTTLVVIAHRLSTIVDADQVVVLHRGAIVEQGKHLQLLQQKGRYYQMYQLQQVGESLNARCDAEIESITS